MREPSRKKDALDTRPRAECSVERLEQLSSVTSALSCTRGDVGGGEDQLHRGEGGDDIHATFGNRATRRPPGRG